MKHRTSAAAVSAVLLAIVISAAPSAQVQIQSISGLTRLIGSTILRTGTAIRVNNPSQVLIVDGRRTFVWSKADGFLEPTFGPSDVAMTKGVDLNDAGEVVGEALSRRGYYEPFIWSKSGGMRLVWPEWPIEESPASAINDVGEVVGSLREWNLASWRWSPTEGFYYGNPLAVLAGPCTSTATDISVWGESVGASVVAATHCEDWDQPPLHAYRMKRDGSIRDLGTLGGADSRAAAINDRGVVVGWSTVAGGNQRAFAWSEPTGMVSLGTLGGSWSRALAINNLNQIVGISRTSSGYTYAFFWSQKTGMVNIGTGVPTAINDLGQVVGTTSTSTVSAAWFWSPIDGRTNFSQNARVLDINDKGQAVGERKTLTPPVYAAAWQLRVTEGETLNWYEARTAVLRYGGVISSTQASTYNGWIANARAALAAGNQTLFNTYLAKLKPALGTP